MGKTGRLIFAASVAVLLHLAALLAPQPFRPRSLVLQPVPEVHLATSARAEIPKQATARVDRGQVPPAQAVIPEPGLPLQAAEPAVGPSSPINAPAATAGILNSTSPSAAALAPAMPVAAAPSRPPVCLRDPKPAMPALSRTLGETGKVRLRLRVDEAGRKSVEILERSGYSRLDAAALAAVRQWICQPALHNGLAIAAELDEWVVFELQ